jgi:hypothetical protein
MFSGHSPANQMEFGPEGQSPFRTSDGKAVNRTFITLLARGFCATSARAILHLPRHASQPPHISRSSRTRK